MTDLRYFSLEEFNRASSNPTPPELVKNALSILSVLDVIRHEWGNPIRILQGGAYRNPDFNQKVGGAPNSQHLHAIACDIRVVCEPFHTQGLVISLKGLIERLLSDGKLPTKSQLGVGLYLRGEGSFIHVDVRKTATKVRWESK